MRWTTAAMVASVLATGSLAIWWPGNSPAPLAVATVQAQESPGAVPPSVEEDTTERNNRATQAKLATYIEANFINAPLSEVLAFVGEKTEVQTYVNAKLLEALGVSLDSPVTINLKRVRADMLLDLAIQEAGASAIDYVVRDGIVVVTTVESLEGASEIKAYPVADLLKLPAQSRNGSDPMDSFGEAAGTPESFEQLVDVISSTVAPDSWQSSGGFGTITHYGDMLVVRQNARTHREVEKLLKLLRETAAKR